MIEPVYILIRTSGRPLFFKRMMETIKNQTYKNIVTIIHSDDPRDQYINGDIIVKGPVYGPEFGDGTYNLYNNRLLRTIPSGPGWYHFIDDDDEYNSNDVIEKLVENSKKECVNVAKVSRWNKTIWPKNWGTQKSYQTECFFLHTDHKLKAQWWGNSGGDHHYSKQLTKTLPINWIENLMICKAQEGKGHGAKKDKGGKLFDYSKSLKPTDKIHVLGLIINKKGPRKNWIRNREIKEVEYSTALELEEKNIAKITYNGTYKKTVARPIYKT